MTQSIQAKTLTLLDVEKIFNFQLCEDEQFFREWIDDLPEIADEEKRSLDKLKAGYINSVKYAMLEDTVKMVVLAPFHIETEKSVELTIEDEDTIVRGSIDVLLLLQSFWVVAIEAKRSQYSVEAGLPQLLFYMLNDPSPKQVTFGLLTNGSSFRFIKVTKQVTPQYAVSKLFDIANPGNELYEVFRILKRLAGIISSNASST